MTKREEASIWLNNWLTANAPSEISLPINESSNLIEDGLLDSFGFVLLVTDVEEQLVVRVDISFFQDLEDYTYSNILSVNYTP